MAIDFDDERYPLYASAVVVALLGLWVAVDDDSWLPILDGANLVFHEAGHKVYGLLGSTLELYGGTLGQLTFPLVGVVLFGYRKQFGSAAICLAWTGQNLFNIARYMADARAHDLPLVGGTEHDWENIFLRWDVLSRDTRIAAQTRTVGWILFAAALLLIAWSVRRLQQQTQR